MRPYFLAITTLFFASCFSMVKDRKLTIRNKDHKESVLIGFKYQKKTDPDEKFIVSEMMPLPAGYRYSVSLATDIYNLRVHFVRLDRKSIIYKVRDTGNETVVFTIPDTHTMNIKDGQGCESVCLSMDVLIRKKIEQRLMIRRT